MNLTLYDKIWNAHCVAQDDRDSLIYIDLHLINEVTSPQAFAGLRQAGRRIRSPERCLAVADHNTPTAGQTRGLSGVHDASARLQLETLDSNAREFGFELFEMGHRDNGIVHVVGPELGRTLPGMTIVCGDSHTSTHGAFGALAHGIGTSEVEHVLATQTLRQRKSKNMRVHFAGNVSSGVSAKDMALAFIDHVGAAGGTGHVVEYGGSAIDSLSMEGRMTLCNMTIEAGARAGMVPPDETTFAYLRGLRPLRDANGLDAAIQDWRQLRSDPGAVFDAEIQIDVNDIAPQVTWGTSPDQVASIGGAVPDPAFVQDPSRRARMQRSLDYMGLRAGTPLINITIDRVFIGSCTNSRIEDLRAAAAVVRGRRIARGIRAMVVPGSRAVSRQAEDEGLATDFVAAGFEWREPGCSMCLGMNPDRLAPGERCASTSNRNFEGRQGRGGRTHLMSPAMAAAAAIAGHLVDVRHWSG